MQADLSPHMHTPKCNELIDALKKCHEDNTFTKFVGVCNTINDAVVKCMKRERIARSAANRAKALERHQLLKQKLSQKQ